MTIAEMRALLELDSSYTDAHVVEAYAAYLDGREEDADAPLVLDLADLKRHLRVDVADDDDLILELIGVAQEVVEAETDFVLTPRDVVATFDCFDQCMRIAAWPITAVSEVAYVAPDGTAALVSDAGFSLINSSRPAVLQAAAGSTLPCAAPRRGSINVILQAGYASPDDVPKRVKQAIRLLVGHFYVNREAVVVDIRAVAVQLPLAVDLLLRRLQRWIV